MNRRLKHPFPDCHQLLPAIMVPRMQQIRQTFESWISCGNMHFSNSVFLSCKLYTLLTRKNLALFSNGYEYLRSLGLFQPWKRGIDRRGMLSKTERPGRLQKQQVQVSRAVYSKITGFTGLPWSYSPRDGTEPGIKDPSEYPVSSSRTPHRLSISCS